MHTFFRILRFAHPMGVLIPQFIIYTLLATIFSVLNFSFIIPLLEVLFQDLNQSPVREFPSFSFSLDYFINLFNYYFYEIIQQSGKLNTLYFVCQVIIAAVFLANLFRYLSNLILARVRVNVIKNLRTKAFNSLSLFDLNYFTEKRKGDIMARITADVLEVENSVMSVLRILFKEPFLILGYFVAMFKISPLLCLYSLVLVPLTGSVIAYIAKRLKRRARLSQETLGRINIVLDESLSGMRIIKAFNATQYISDKFFSEVQRYGRHVYRLAAKYNLASPISEFLGVFVACMILIIGGSMVLDTNSGMSASQFIGFLIFFSQILSPAKAITNSLSNINRGLASAERVFEVIDTVPQIMSKEDAIKVVDLQDAIQFENVSFNYEEARVLSDINLSIKKGKITALVGPSGGGKSTLVDLIPRFYDPKSGKITLDGTDLRDYQLESLRKMMGIVTQESILFNDTIANNIAFGIPNASLESIQDAAKIANAHEFIIKMDKGYQSVIGERGTKLSGGQRQRISIARALLKNPPILILDEATSALDSESEKLVQDAIYKLMQNRTAIVIAHRLSTIQNADHIVVLQDGKILEEGTHQTLMKKKGLYKRLTEMQSF